MRSWREQNTRAKQHDAMKQPHSLNVTTFFLPEITIYYAWPSAVLVFPSHTSPCREAKKTKIYKCIKSLIPYQFQPFFNSTLFMMTYRCTAKTTAQSIIFFILLRHNKWCNRKKISAMCERGQLIEEPFNHFVSIYFWRVLEYETYCRGRNDFTSNSWLQCLNYQWDSVSNVL